MCIYANTCTVFAKLPQNVISYTLEIKHVIGELFENYWDIYPYFLGEKINLWNFTDTYPRIDFINVKRFLSIAWIDHSWKPDQIALAQWPGATENLSQRRFNAPRCSPNTLKRTEIKIYSSFFIFYLYFMMSTFGCFLHSWSVWKKIEF